MEQAKTPWGKTRTQCFEGLSDEFYDLTNSGSVECIENISAVEFLRDCIAPNKPVVIKNAVSNWPALQKWKSMDYLRSKVGSTTVTVDLTPTGHGDAIVGDLFVTPASTQMDVSTFLDRIDPASPIYCPPSQVVHYISHQNSNLTSEFDVLMDDVEIEIDFATEALGVSPDAVNIWMGQEQAVTSMHKDHYENLYVVVHGKKTFNLLPPCTFPFLYENEYTQASYRVNPVKTFLHKGLPTHSSHFEIDVPKESEKVPWISVDPSNPDFDRFPLYKHAHKHLLTVTIESGDMLYLPSLWYHQVLQTQNCPSEPVIAVNYWYDMNYDAKYAYYMFLRSLVLQSSSISTHVANAAVQNASREGSNCELTGCSCSSIVRETDTGSDSDADESALWRLDQIEKAQALLSSRRAKLLSQLGDVLHAPDSNYQTAPKAPTKLHHHSDGDIVHKPRNHSAATEYAIAVAGAAIVGVLAYTASRVAEL